MYYFAYGSNLLKSRLEAQNKEGKHIGEVEDCGVAVLKGYKVKYNKRSKNINYPPNSGVANIVESKESEVLGVVYKLSNEQHSLLTRIEGGYKEELKEVFQGGKSLSAYTYVAKSTEENLSVPDKYLKFIIDGAKGYNFPDDYINSLKDS